PPCAKYAAFDVIPVTSPRSQLRIIIGTDQSIWYTNNHYRSFYQIVAP
ncbi:MAG: guanine-specific ribonuclease N1 and T1, partial [Alphaproteobacteria bacterium]|nr:guanine-specific ribonuclease N1 and T1 [Alphaproteobacteria bacterium]